MLLLQLILNGLQVGAIYALTAAGFSLIFGSTKIFHFAHGATFTIAAYLFHYALTNLGLHWTLGVAMAAGGAVLFGILLDRFMYAPIQRHEGSFFTVFVASFGIGIVVENVIGMVFGRSFISVSTSLSRSVELLPDLYVSPLVGLAVLTSLVCFVAVHMFLMHTHAGMALRALSENTELVKTFGLSPRRLSAYAFALGSVLVVPAAIFTASSSGLNPAVGHHVMLISLAATIVGGIGSIRGAAFAGLLIGMVENVALWQVGTQWSEALTFAVLFFFIIFRPSGFFGRAAVS
ncbi:branched-chain amino acid ABC transporter permease [Marinobacter salinexigens]|uniref:Branched-chain amino acid ABC transporter permease n=1 Tax=Marinobacter salinexigens TaxID=2919747 RepID=A0A5B0VEA0_9GAMM|nr:branched-chain amino acid ABC transporter permease [Marinobacter salinexigens]KAA1172321.1 branched-chain amino acid ABC transporter permease [Marinobacter salinexigens]